MPVLPAAAGRRCLTALCPAACADTASVLQAASDSVESGLAAIAKQILQTDPEARESLRRYEEAVVSAVWGRRRTWPLLGQWAGALGEMTSSPGAPPRS
mgnify:CR=1 FL=1